ncbi:DUF4221 family protein [Fabibacter sp. E12]|nr:DUF4221 family protein [Roseivirga sp. E12]
MKIIIILCSVVAFCSCSNQNGEKYLLETTFSSQKNLVLEVDSISIDVGDYGLFYYPLSTTAEIQGTRFYFGWNHTTFSLDIVNLDKSEYYKSIKYEVNGPNGIGDVKGLSVVDFDSIFFLSSQYLTLIDSNTNVTSKWGINEKNEFQGFSSQDHNLTTEETFNIFFDNRTKKLYARLHFPRFAWCDTELGYYNENFIGELDLFNLSFRELNIGYPPEFRELSFGFRDIPAVTFDPSGLINYTFSISSNIYQYSLETGKTSSFGGASDFTRNHADALQIEDCPDTPLGMKHNLLNVKFMHLLQDPYRKLYYRFHWGDVPEHRADGRFNAYNDKPLFLTVFDDQLKKLMEMEVDRKQGAAWCFVDEAGLHILKPRGSENVLGFNLYKFL